MSIIKLNRGGIFIPPTFIKEELDRSHRQDWADPDRYRRQLAKALTYIPERAATIKDFSWEQMVREVARVFHDDLALEPSIKEAAQQACWAAEQDYLHEVDLGQQEPEPATPVLIKDGDKSGDKPREQVRGVDDDEETLASLEWQEKEEHDTW